MTMEKITAGDPLASSADVLAENIERLKTIFPEVFTEGKVDFDVLRQLLGDAVDESEEKYGLNWFGKRQARQAALTASTGTLRPCPQDSVDWDTTRNLMIEGDNLEVLKLLQKSYAGKVKMIYIDPPYNTGKDFVYPDDYRDGIKNYQELTGQVEDGRKISSNTEASGRFHTDWLNMMYPRIKLAKALLSSDGAIFISIDDNELFSLKLICDEVFGDENFISSISVKMSEPTGVKMAHVEKKLPKLKEHILFYKKHTLVIKPVSISKDDWDPAYNLFLDNISRDEVERLKSIRDNEERKDSEIAEVDLILSNAKVKPLARAQQERGVIRENEKIIFNYKNSWRIIRSVSMSGRGRMIADLKQQTNSNELFSIVTVEKKMYVIKNGYDLSMESPRIKVIFADDYLTVNPGDFWQDIKTTGLGDEGGVDFLNGKKPLKLLQRFIKLVSNEKNDIVLDFFAGSGTMGQAVLEENFEDDNTRRFILVQFPEHTGDANFATIAEITKERLRRAGKKIKEENPLFAGDLGFRVFKLDSSNIRAWEADAGDLAGTLEASVQHIKPDRGEADILYELLLKLGLDLCVPIEKRVVAGKAVHSIGQGVLLACLAEHISADEAEALAEGIAAWHTQLATVGDVICVFRDSAFADDVTKTNLAAILEQHGIARVRSL